MNAFAHWIAHTPEELLLRRGIMPARSAIAEELKRIIERNRPRREMQRKAALERYYRKKKELQNAKT